MPTERMEVEVVQPKLGTGPARRVENGPDVWLAEVYPGSLTAARLRLADAAEAVENAEQLCRSAPSGPEYDAADKAYDVAAEAYQAAVDALAALRTKRAGG